MPESVPAENRDEAPPDDETALKSRKAAAMGTAVAVAGAATTVAGTATAAAGTATGGTAFTTGIVAGKAGSVLITATVTSAATAATIPILPIVLGVCILAAGYRYVTRPAPDPDADPNKPQQRLLDESRQTVAGRQYCVFIPSSPYCPICLEEYEEGDIVHVLTCNHQVCATCIEAQKEATTCPNTCPFCRVPFEIL
mmetsp:Transcript_8657/g.15722  ORF Transcript_8657/g.15722 Transcript_8657/m.15722 type:complete len:197 (+) Transcript_8657:212-802(+)|eukprot:CAMPEP_0182491186 /NCGR_PEP_ID=MMETSP1321-20130603/748_1 /TAXON_ID=91990 /ORGANISM="Bolidomonas sp., Strain RCC1657" /LENGTH=196 /DNA_ID=CAMNT_0024693449 /DNA_START=63 /DNA_END=653 /DNA_ORIENTATION=-